MDKKNYGLLIKQLRTERKWTQYELAEGVCSQATISKIEKGLLVPDAEILMGLAKKFDTKVSLLLGETEELPPFHKEVLRLLSLYRYEALKHLLDKHNYLDQDPLTMIPHQLWLLAILTSQLDQNHELALTYLDRIDQQATSQLSDDFKLSILSSRSGIHSHLHQYDQELHYLNQCKTIIEESKQTISHRHIIRTYFALARLHNILNQLPEAIYYAQKNINIIIEKDSLLTLDDTYLTLARIYLKTQQLDKTLTHIQMAETIANLKHNTTLLPYIERTKVEILTQKTD